jgi:hypothetical protein
MMKEEVVLIACVPIERWLREVMGAPWLAETLSTGSLVDLPCLFFLPLRLCAGQAKWVSCGRKQAPIASLSVGQRYVTQRIA